MPPTGATASIVPPRTASLVGGIQTAGFRSSPGPRRTPARRKAPAAAAIQGRKNRRTRDIGLSNGTAKTGLPAAFTARRTRSRFSRAPKQEAQSK